MKDLLYLKIKIKVRFLDKNKPNAFYVKKNIFLFFIFYYKDIRDLSHDNLIESLSDQINSVKPEKCADWPNVTATKTNVFW